MGGSKEWMASNSLGVEPSGLGDVAALEGKEREESKPEARALLLPLSGRWSHAGGWEAWAAARGTVRFGRTMVGMLVDFRWVPWAGAHRTLGWGWM